MDATEQSPARGNLLTRTPEPRETLIFGVVLALLSALPVLASAIPQMADYASHLARYHIMMDEGRSPFLTGYYGFEWRWSGNLGADILIWPFAKIFGLEAGTRIMTAVIPAVTGLGIVTVEWVLRRRIGAGSLLALVVIWSPALAMGFLNFCLSLAAALFAFALWVKLERWRWRWALFLPISLAVWLCHMSGWGVLGVMVFAYELHRRRGLSAFLAPWPLLPPFGALLFGGGTSGLLDYGERVGAYKLGIFLQAMRDQNATLDMLSLMLLIVLFVWALARRRIDGRLGIAAGLLWLLAFAIPRHLGGGDYADYRLMSVALMIGCMAIDVSGNKPGPRAVLWLASALFLVRLGVTTEAWVRTSRESEEMLTVIDRLPVGARVAGAVLIDRTDWTMNPFQHLPSYATVRRDALVNTHFAVPGVHMLRLKEGGPGFIDPSHRVFHSPGEPIDLSRFPPASQADYLWYVGREPPTRLPGGAAVIYRAQGALLARLANRRGGG